MITRPDSALVHELFPSPNIEPRQRGLVPSHLILHYTGLADVTRALDVLSRPDCKVSCHYVVDVDGRVVQMVAEEMRAWHAGLSYWGGETDLNSASIGIEIQNPGHHLGYCDFPAAQMRSVTTLSRDIVSRHAIAPRRVLAHSDIAPSRKIDPGEKFDWRALAEAGVGVWIEPAPLAADGTPGAERDASERDVAEARDLLAAYGYGVECFGNSPEGWQHLLRAFQLHFRPARWDGRLDRSTLDTLRRLVAMTPVA